MMKRILPLLAFLITYSISSAQIQTGKASYYADKFEGQPTASGEKYKHNKLTAAHKSLPFGTKVRVTNTANNQSVEVVINDRGPFVEDRIIDLSKSAAEKLGFITQGLAEVKVEVIDAGDGKGGGQVKPVGNVAVSDKEYYDFGVKKVNLNSGFGVQIGTFQELANLIRLTENLNSSYRKNVTVQVKLINGIKYYSIIVGQLPNRKKAESLRQEIKKRYPDAFVVEFSPY